MRKRLKKKQLRLEKRPRVSFKERFRFTKTSKTLYLVGRVIGYPFREFNKMNNCGVAVVVSILFFVLIYFMAKASLPTLTVTSSSVTELLQKWNTRNTFLGYSIINCFFMIFFILCAKPCDHPPSKIPNQKS